MDTQDHAIYRVWIHLFSYLLGEKPFGLELEANPGPLAPQATAPTTRPCLTRQLNWRWSKGLGEGHGLIAQAKNSAS